MSSLKFLALYIAFASSCSIAAVPIAVVSNPSGMRDLCSFEGGRWCVPCGQPGTPACPEVTDSGPLCCSGGICKEWTGGSCGGVLGWCKDYTTETTATGVLKATCHDVPGGAT